MGSELSQAKDSRDLLLAELLAEQGETVFAPGPCTRCGRDPAVGFASVNGKWLCHGDLDPTPTCYMRAQADLARPEGAN